VVEKGFAVILLGGMFTSGLVLTGVLVASIGGDSDNKAHVTKENRVNGGDENPWEETPSPSECSSIWRQSVPEGWIVMTRCRGDGQIVFVPDVAHVWSAR